MKSFEMARELESNFIRLNFYITKGGYTNALCMAPQSEHLDTLAGQYLSLIDDLRILAASIESEVETARKNHIPGDAQY